MEGEKGKEIKRNASKWKELAYEAVDEGGSFDKNIDDLRNGVAGGSCYTKQINNNYLPIYKG
ncbi:conserved hypothetical protein [Ricinus communis]|uniref:Uncharacterized protein n=1 Tax=Ricinus communis TaxID=3988 RepID=B9T2H9_RICCO|nr:conserved hypothetical protein [Ricinus communis]